MSFPLRSEVSVTIVIKIKTTRTCLAQKNVDCIVIFFRVCNFGCRYFHRERNALAWSSTTFREFWVSWQNFTSVILHPPRVFPWFPICPPQDNQVGNSKSDSVNSYTAAIGKVGYILIEETRVEVEFAIWIKSRGDVNTASSKGICLEVCKSQTSTRRTSILQGSTRAQSTFQ